MLYAYTIIGPNKRNPNQFMVSQNVFYNFYNLIYNVILSPRWQDLVYWRLISKGLEYYGKSRLQWVPLLKILDTRIRVIHFEIRV